MLNFQIVLSQKIPTVMRFSIVHWYSNEIPLISYFLKYYSLGCMDIFVLLNRIQMINPKLKMFKKSPIFKVTLLVMLCCILVNIPINAARGIISYPIKIESNETAIEKIMYAYGKILLIILLILFKLRINLNFLK